MPVLFGQRSVFYNLSLLGIVVCSVLTFIGCVAPFWTVVSPDEPSNSNSGLWWFCYETPYSSECSLYSFSSMKVWLHFVRFFVITGALCMLFASVYGVGQNSCDDAPKRTRKVEAYALIGGLLAFIGAMIFLGEVRKADDPREFAWAFYLAVVGSSGAIVASIAFICANTDIFDNPDSGGVVRTQYTTNTTSAPAKVQTTDYPNASFSENPASQPQQYGVDSAAYSVPTPAPQAGYPGSGC